MLRDPDTTARSPPDFDGTLANPLPDRLLVNSFLLGIFSHCEFHSCRLSLPTPENQDLILRSRGPFTPHETALDAHDQGGHAVDLL